MDFSEEEAESNELIVVRVTSVSLASTDVDAADILYCCVGSKHSGSNEV